jgi:hypothetical protein
LQHQSRVLSRAELKHEIFGKSLEVATDLLVQPRGPDPVKCGEFGVDFLQVLDGFFEETASMKTSRSSVLEALGSKYVAEPAVKRARRSRAELRHGDVAYIPDGAQPYTLRSGWHDRAMLAGGVG